jgi:hypothetical protein
VEEIKPIPHAPMSHPFVERLIGSIRRELLDHTFFWTVTDLEKKLQDYQAYYNQGVLTLDGMAQPLSKRPAAKSSISISTAGTSTAEDYLNCQ